jgi:hypothetical protein
MFWIDTDVEFPVSGVHIGSLMTCKTVSEGRTSLSERRPMAGPLTRVHVNIISTGEVLWITLGFGDLGRLLRLCHIFWLLLCLSTL